MKKKSRSSQVYPQVGRVSSESVSRGTGRSWDEWIAILQKNSAQNWQRKEIPPWLEKKYKLNGWWSQIVTHGFQVAMGLRIDGQNSKGEYSLVVTKSIHLPAMDVWKFLVSRQGLALWLTSDTSFKLNLGSTFETEDGFFGEVRTLKAGQRVRLRWSLDDVRKPTTVQVFINPRPSQRCNLCFQQEGLKSPREKMAMRDHWRRKLEMIYEQLPTHSGKSSLL